MNGFQVVNFGDNSELTVFTTGLLCLLEVFDRSHVRNCDVVELVLLRNLLDVFPVLNF